MVDAQVAAPIQSLATDGWPILPVGERAREGPLSQRLGRPIPLPAAVHLVAPQSSPSIAD